MTTFNYYVAGTSEQHAAKKSLTAKNAVFLSHSHENAGGHHDNFWVWEGEIVDLPVMRDTPYGEVELFPA